MSISTIMPVLMYALNPRGTVSAIYCRVKTNHGQAPAPRGYRVRNVINGHVILENLATEELCAFDREDLSNIRVFVTWEEAK